MIKKLLLSIIFALPFFTHSFDIKESKQLNKIHANPFNDSYIIVFSGSPESFSIDKISINKPKERTLKKVKFLTNEIRADAVDVTVFEKICKNTNCKTNKIQSKLEKEIKLAILKKATIMEKDGFQKYYEKEGKNKAGILERKE